MKKFSTQWSTILLVFALVFPALGAAESEQASDDASDASSSEITVSGPPTSPLNFGIDFQFIPARYPGYQYTATAQSNRMGMGGRFGFEWLPLAGRYGKGGIGAGAGYTRVSKVPVGNGVTSYLETVPVDVYLTYRFDYLNDQFFVPFVKAGFERHFARQQATAATYHYNGWNASVGAAMLLDWIDRSSAQQLDNSTGINNTYLTFEYLISRRADNRTINMSRDELRLGLRFEM